MSELKWAVLGTETGGEWLVVHPGDVWRWSDGRLEGWAVHSRHGTWAEAMQEADRQARTITVTLPANSGIEITARTGRYAGWASLHPPFHLVAADADLENIALIILAHARRMQS